MDHASFHTLRTAVQHNARPAGELPAASLQRDLTEALSASRLFDQVELGRTDDPDQLVIGLCRCADGVMPWEAGVGVERIWRHASAALSLGVPQPGVHRPPDGVRGAPPPSTAAGTT